MPRAMLLALVAVLALGVLGPALAAEEEGIRVVGVTPSAADGGVGVSVECASLFSPKALSTLQSGLSAVVRLELQVQRHGRARTLLGGRSGEFETVTEIAMARSISYDVWDERYTVRSQGVVDEYVDLGAVQDRASQFAHDHLVATAELDADGVYRIRARVQLLPVSPEEGERLAAWLHVAQVGDESSGPSGGRGAGFNVGGLFSMLRGRGETARDRSAWVASEVFQVGADGKLRY